MNVPVVARKQGLATFDPQKALENDAKADALIAYAKQVKDWPTLKVAVKEKIADQAVFCEWWKEKVRKPGGDQRSLTRSDVNDFLSRHDAEKISGITQQQVSKWNDWLSKLDAYESRLFGKAYQAAMGEEHNHRAQGTGENEWYTPAKYIEMARWVMDGIDLDPASSEAAQKVVQASHFYSAEDDGLSKEWIGRVWLNPPYAQPLISQFVEKMVEERRADRVSDAIMLTHNYTDTSWFHSAAGIADAICFTRGRIKFVDADGGECAPTQGQAFFYLGSDVARFASVFQAVGFVVTPCP